MDGYPECSRCERQLPSLDDHVLERLGWHIRVAMPEDDKAFAGKVYLCPACAGQGSLTV